MAEAIVPSRRNLHTGERAVLKPYIGVLSATDATAKSLTIRNIELSVTRS